MVGRDATADTASPAVLLRHARGTRLGPLGARTRSIRPGPATSYQGEAIGVRDGVAKCLYCHVTNPRSGRDPAGPETADRAIGCERCHGPGGHHLGGRRGRPARPGDRQSRRRIARGRHSQQCNDCHILGRDFRKDDLSDPAWIRSQGVGWTFSRCNTESGGAFGCVTCHDPHKQCPVDHDCPVRGQMPLVSLLAGTKQSFLPRQSVERLPGVPHASRSDRSPPPEPDGPLYPGPARVGGDRRCRSAEVRAMMGMNPRISDGGPPAAGDRRHDPSRRAGECRVARPRIVPSRPTGVVRRPRDRSHQHTHRRWIGPPSIPGHSAPGDDGLRKKGTAGTGAPLTRQCRFYIL